MITYEFDEETDKVYEVDERGNKELVRSLQSRMRTFLRFRNKTSRIVDVWWRDYQGTKYHYARIKPGRYNDVNSFITHPWEFTDASTREHYAINNKPIFRPPEAVGGMEFRTNWNITITVRTLKKTTMIAINRYLQDINGINALEIPRVLAEELQHVITDLRKPPSPIMNN